MDGIRTLYNWHWSIPILAVLCFLIIFHLSVNFLHKFLGGRLERENRQIGLLLLKIIYKPIKIFLWFTGFALLASLYAHHFFDIKFVSTLSEFLRVGVIIGIAWVMHIVSLEVQSYLERKKRIDITSLEIFSKISFIAIAVVTLLLVLPLFGIQIAGLLAFGGFSGIVIGFASKDIMSNILGSFLFAIEKPFKIGERIFTTDGKIDGFVEHIGWRMVKIRTLDKKLLYVPNITFTSISFVNDSRMSHRRILQTIGVRYEDFHVLPRLLEELKNYIQTSEYIDHKQIRYIHFISFGASSLDMELRAFTKTIPLAEFNPVLEKILLDIYQIILKHKAEVAYPTSTLFAKIERIESMNSFKG